jgi:hypothetical protein
MVNSFYKGSSDQHWWEKDHLVSVSDGIVPVCHQVALITAKLIHPVSGSVRHAGCSDDSVRFTGRYKTWGWNWKTEGYLAVLRAKLVSDSVIGGFVAYGDVCNTQDVNILLHYLVYNCDHWSPKATDGNISTGFDARAPTGTRQQTYASPLQRQTDVIPGYASCEDRS